MSAYLHTAYYTGSRLPVYGTFNLHYVHSCIIVEVFLYTEIYSSKFIHIGATMFNKTVAFA